MSGQEEYWGFCHDPDLGIRFPYAVDVTKDAHARLRHSKHPELAVRCSLLRGVYPVPARRFHFSPPPITPSGFPAPCAQQYARETLSGFD